MLKINLSDEEGGTGEQPEEQKTMIQSPEGDALPPEGEQEESDTAETVAAPPPGTPESDTGDEPADENDDKKTGAGTNTKRLLVLLLLVVVAAATYFQRDTLLGLFSGPDMPEETVQAPPPPPPAPAPEPVPAEPDPTFVTLNDVGDAMPPHVWLSAVTLRYDGSYGVKGMAFSHAAVGTFIDELGTIGEVTSRTVPPAQKSAETVYNFAVNGHLGGVDVPEILDVIPSDRLTLIAAPVKAREEEYGVKFTVLPDAGKVYGENDMPFALVGSYTGLKRVIADLCPEGGDVKVYHMSIMPAAPGRVFDYIRASFSLRTVSSI